MAGELDDLKGRVKEGVGDATDDDRLRREGQMDRAGGKVKDVAERARDKVGDAVDAVRDRVTDRGDRG